MPTTFIIAVATLAGILAMLVGMRAPVTRTREGKILAFVGLLILPVAAMGIGFTGHMERAQTTEFCLSCHVMSEHGRSLAIDDPSYLPARHYQNNSIPRDRACYTCHTDYTMFGGVNAKLRGLRHLWVQYAGTIPPPKDVKLYTPYHNRECLFCHQGARNFEEASPHQKPDLLTRAKANQLSCMSSGCHEFVHDVESLGDVKFWKER